MDQCTENSSYTFFLNKENKICLKVERLSCYTPLAVTKTAIRMAGKNARPFDAYVYIKNKTKTEFVFLPEGR